jgi:predicted house-cleaning NTP pyrophosphatase (Maf/HAM1 superfamily)
MVTELADKVHRIYTANIVVFNSNGPLIRHEWVSKAEVTFGKIPPEVIKEFAKEKEPYIHSGGYEVGAISGSFITSINGSYHVVQGLDIHGICLRLIEGGRQLGWI